MPKSAGNSNVEKLKTGKAKFLVLLVGINQYDDGGIDDLNYCVNDCQKLKVALEKATQVFPEKNIIVHHDHTPELPIVDVVKQSLEKLVTQATKEDTILVYFSGHGFLDKQTQQPILCLKNTQINSLATTGLPVGEVLLVLRELWEKRRDGILSLQVYQEEIGGFKEVLENKAEDVRRGLHGEEESCAQFIFLELVQLGEEGKDTRRRVLKSELLGKKYGKEVMESVLKKLSDARLIVVGGDRSPLTPLNKGGTHQQEKASLVVGGNLSPLVPLSKGGTHQQEKVAFSQESLPNATKPHSILEDNNKKAPLPKGGLGGSEITVEVAHEILIRHWSTLRQWLDKNRTRLQKQREIDERAKKWKQVGQVDGSLLKDVELQQAERETLY
ncbi:caspase family protein [Okeania sp. SIO1I7]|uniref:nSTAND1 domain-containing NTPase n=1 Tax=Okeania sp. SIO1I7 TaxID=2607772 RepID=UPI0013F7FC11|nr:caspase family protein [Okeania sp. SIO1I7]NET26318.1 hypothetical protein [Okeania sp. SIO1I7]